MTQFLPPNLLALFAPRDPIPFLPQLEKLPHEKHHNQPYCGIAPFIRHFEVLCALFYVQLYLTFYGIFERLFTHQVFHQKMVTCMMQITEYILESIMWSCYIMMFCYSLLVRTPEMRHHPQEQRRARRGWRERWAILDWIEFPWQV